MSDQVFGNTYGHAECERRASPHPIVAADLFGDIEPTVLPRWRELVPGLLIVLLGTLAAGFLWDRYHAPLTLMALLIGLALNFLSADKRLSHGVGFASRSLLRWGIVLAGVRVTFGQVIALGPMALLAVLGIVGLTIGTGILAARRLGGDAAFGTLAGGAVAICGASAAIALATTLGHRRVTQAQLVFVLVGISAMSALAMVTYPIAAHALRLSDLKAGFLLGASIHDIAQALGAGYSYSPGAGEIATIVKLIRVALLAPILAIAVTFFPHEDGGRSGPGIPWFVVGFFVLAGINSVGVIPAAIAVTMEGAATGLLAAAVIATGIQSPLGQLLGAGPRPLVILLLATLVAFGASLCAAILLI